MTDDFLYWGIVYFKFNIIMGVLSFFGGAVIGLAKVIHDE